MLIDWFTVIAQIINFLILVVLLKIFLYDRIVEAIDQRRQEADEEFQEAEEKQKAAEQKKKEYEQKSEELDEKRDELMREARGKAEDKREELLEDARKEVDRKKEQWTDSLRSHKDQFVDNLRDELTRRLGDTARRALADLADAELEQQVIKVFSKRISELDDDKREDIRSALEEAENLTVHSAWELPEEVREQIKKDIGEVLDGDHSIDFATDGDMACGIEIRGKGHAVGWNIDDYLRDLMDDIRSNIEEEASTGEEEEKHEDKSEDEDEK
ncbi:MAG: hypothetical protein ACOC29_00925 [Candidatus Sumerlaeota bacterium]